MINIAIIHPSFKRSSLCVAAFREWVSSSSNPSRIEHLIALDSIDPTIEEYKAKFAEVEEVKKVGRFEISVGDSTNAIQAMNRAARMMSSSTELIIVLSDDIGSIPQWDIELFKLLEGVDNFSTPKLIWPSDGYWQYGTVLTYYMANRAFYNRIGHILSEEYTSMFSDNELTEIGRILGAFVHAPHLTFQHRHYSKGYTLYDETYARRNNPTEFEKNRNVFLRRKARNFDL